MQRIGGITLFPQRGSARLREMQYDFGSDRFASPDLCALAPDIAGGAFTATAYADVPDGTLYGLRADGKLAVVGVLMRESAVQNRTLWSIWKNMPAKEGPEVEVPAVSINPATLLPESLAHYAYEGSLTTPPCSEGVQFFILKKPVTLSAEQLAAFRRLYPMNARPLQPLNERVIKTSN